MSNLLTLKAKKDTSNIIAAKKSNNCGQALPGA
jgi:hypothetical protein